ncbi:RNA methyltransferase [Deinococcus radiomollis]|uniref:TrmH family RNA methyltransferase n=1 Tax=Deinococcus radiomollis TaxID=468916 RepID=UPI0038921237
MSVSEPFNPTPTKPAPTKPEPINSVQNPQVKRLVRLKNRRERDAEGVWLIEGARELGRAQGGGVRLLQLFACPELFSDEATELWPALENRNTTLLSRAAFEKASHRENPDGLMALAEPPSPALPDASGTRPMLVLVLMGLEKPGNLGALLRTADGVGVDAVLVVGSGDDHTPAAQTAPGETDLGNPGVIRASQGSVFTQPVVSLPAAQALDWLRKSGFRLVACTPEAEAVYWDAPLTGRVALCLGSEHDGLPALWREGADLRVSIPMQGQADSLNVSVAGALVLYEARRQRAAASAAVSTVPTSTATAATGGPL